MSELRKALANFKPGNEVYDGIVPYRDQVIARYGPVFSCAHTPNLSHEEFRSFLYEENNHHWSGLCRKGLGAAADIEKLRQALGVLLDEGKPIRERFTRALKMVKGIGKGVATAILTVAYPDRYGVWNNSSEAAIKRLGIWPNAAEKGGVGGRYEKVNELLQRLRSDLGIDFWTLDGLWRSLPDTEPAGGDGEDKFGSRLGTSRAKFNAALTTESLTMKQLMEKAGLTDTMYNHARELMAKGLVVKSADGYKLAEAGNEHIGPEPHGAHPGPQTARIGEGLDKFGARLGSRKSQINALLSAETPKTVKQIREEGGIPGSYVDYMDELAKRGIVRGNHKEGWVLVKEA